FSDAVAAKRGGAAANGVLEATAVRVVQPGPGGLVDKARRAEGDRRRRSRGQSVRHDRRAHSDDRSDPEGEPPPAHPERGREMRSQRTTHGEMVARNGTLRPGLTTPSPTA